MVLVCKSSDSHNILPTYQLTATLRILVALHTDDSPTEIVEFCFTGFDRSEISLQNKDTLEYLTV